MPPTLTTQFQGTAQAFQSSLQGMGMLLLLAIVVIYLVLGILYESFIHPITILSGSADRGPGRAADAARSSASSSTCTRFVGMIMLIGIVKKNAIMMIDFAIEAQRKRRQVARRGDLRGVHHPLPADHDDDHGRADGQPADRDRLRRRRRRAPAARPRGGRRAAWCRSS